MVVINHINGIVKALNDLKVMGYNSCAIIRTPDYSGGHRDCLQFSYNEDEDWWEDLEPFCYVEWNGTIADLYREWPTMTMHREPFHEEPVDCELDLFEEIKGYIEWLKSNTSELKLMDEYIDFAIESDLSLLTREDLLELLSNVHSAKESLWTEVQFDDDADKSMALAYKAIDRVEEALKVKLNTSGL